MHSLTVDNGRFILILQTMHQAEKVIAKSGIFLEWQNSPAAYCLWLYYLLHQLIPAPTSTFWEVEAKHSSLLVGSCCCRDMACTSTSCNTVLFTSQPWCGKTVLSASLRRLELAQPGTFCGVPLAQFGTNRSRYSWNGICLEKTTQLFSFES